MKKLLLILLLIVGCGSVKWAGDKTCVIRDRSDIDNSIYHCYTTSETQCNSYASDSLFNFSKNVVNWSNEMTCEEVCLMYLENGSDCYIHD